MCAYYSTKQVGYNNYWPVVARGISQETRLIKDKRQKKMEFNIEKEL